jgi:hypothetical protein
LGPPSSAFFCLLLPSSSRSFLSRLSDVRASRHVISGSSPMRCREFSGHAAVADHCRREDLFSRRSITGGDRSSLARLTALMALTNTLDGTAPIARQPFHEFTAAIRGYLHARLNVNLRSGPSALRPIRPVRPAPSRDTGAREEPVSRTMSDLFRGRSPPRNAARRCWSRKRHVCFQARYLVGRCRQHWQLASWPGPPAEPQLII